MLFGMTDSFFGNNNAELSLPWAGRPLLRTTLPAFVSGGPDARPPDGAGAEVKLEDAAETELAGALASPGSSRLEAGCSPAERKSPTSLVNKQMHGCMGC